MDDMEYEMSNDADIGADESVGKKKKLSQNAKRMIEFGAPEEVAASADGTSPLFTGGKGKWINSVTTLCSPHNGSTLYYVADNYNLVESALKLLYSIGGVTDAVDGGLIDFRLEHFGIDSSSEDAADRVAEAFSTGIDNAFFDLSPEGAALMNETIQTVDSVYYFSYAYCTTEKSPFSDNQIPIGATLTVLKPTALLMGRYTQSGSGKITIDGSWLPNDGLVNVVSAQHPADEEWLDYGSEEELKRGVWYVMPVQAGDHGTVIGLNADAELTHRFYTDLIDMINPLKRIR